jgi:PKD repeat protein
MSVHENAPGDESRNRHLPRGLTPSCGAVLLLLALGACKSTTVTVVDVELVEVQPAETSVVAGATMRLEVRVQGPGGSLLAGRQVSWSSSDETVATVDAEGGVTGHREGTALITARVDGVSASAFVEVLPGPKILPDRSEVTFAAPAGGNDPPETTVAIGNGGAGQLTGLSVDVDYSAGQPDGWLSASLADTRAPTNLSLHVTTGALREETYTARVILRSPEAEQAAVQVSFAVGDPEPRITLDRTEVQMEATQGKAAPGPAEIRITNAGGQSLSGLGASVDHKQGGVGWLTTGLSPSTAPATLQIRADHDELAVGTHVAVVKVFSAVAVNSPREVTVRLVVFAPPPAINLEQSSVQFATLEGGSDPDPVEVEIRNNGGGTLSGLTVSISWNEGGTGWLDARLSDTEAPATLTLTPTTEGLAAGEHEARVRVSAPAAEGTATLEVGLRVDAPENEAPQADFAVDCTLLVCSFQDRSEDPDGEVEYWDWDFGDGDGTSARNPSHTYDEPGSYTVTLEVTDDDGAKDQVTREVTVSVPDSNEPPIAAFDVDCDDDLECKFQDKSQDKDGNIVAREWSFGDGNTSTKKDPKHEYDEPGTYVVRLRVTDNDGATDTVEVSVEVDDD